MMIRKIFSFILLAATLLLITACESPSEPGIASAGVPGNRASNETPAPATGSTTQESPAATASTPEAEAPGSQLATGGAAAPAPTIAAPQPETASKDAATSVEVPVDGQTLDTQAMMSLALSSPGVLSCLAGKMEMQALFQLAQRAPTDEEITLLLPCLTDEQGADEPTLDTDPSVPAATATPTPAPRTILAQALDSAGLMWCLADKVGMKVLIELDSRAPSSQERSTIDSCLFDTREIAAWNAEWPKRIDAAFTPWECGAAPATNFPDSYYQGPFIDTHLHLPQLPDHSVSGPVDDGYVQATGVDSGAYDAISKDQQPLLGTTVTVAQVACSLQNEGTIKAFTFFPTFPEITTSAIDVAYRTVNKYPSLFVPFIQASANRSTTLAGESLEVMLGVHPDLFFGFGEVGSSPTESDNPAPDSKIYTGDWEVARDRGLTVWYHPGEGHIEALERSLQSFPEVTFVVHGDVIRPFIDGMMDRNPNVYFTYNDIFDDLIPTFRFGDKEVFVSDMRAAWDRLLDEAYTMYGSMIKAHPDRYMWGTDRGDIVWQYDEDIGQLLTEYARAFIGRFDPDIQEMIAYKNAERLIGDYGKP